MNKLVLGGLLATTMMSAPALAQHHDHHHTPGMDMSGGHDHSAHITAPVGVMGSHLHEQGDWMVSYRYMRMEMSDMRDGTDDLSPEEIVANTALYPNPNAGPAGFRVIPDEMSMDMHMLGAMYGLTDSITLMGMANYLKKDMNHITFQGMGAGTTRLGEFETTSSGWGDTKLGGLIKLYDRGQHQIHANAMFSIPTGSIKETDDVLTPMNTRQVLRLPYAMQLGSGTYDAEPGITYNGHAGKWGWGAQYAATIRLESENDQDYALGDIHKLSGWAGYQLTDWLNVTGRISGETIGDIDGADPLIAAPVTTADPDNYGGEFIETGIGFRISPPTTLKGLQFGGEFTVPVYQDLNGPQMKRDYGFTLGLQYSF